MRKLFLLLPIFCAFALISCNDDNYYTDETPDTSITDNSNDANDDKKNDGLKETIESEDKEESPLPDYEDDTEWKGKIF